MQHLRRLFLICLVGDALLVAWLAYASRFDRPWLLDVRSAFFSSFTPELTAFELDPDRLVAKGFKVDASERLEWWKARVRGQVGYMQGVPERLEGLPTVEKVRTLVPIYSKNGRGGKGGAYRDLMHNVQRVQRDDGYGNCSDHSQVFIALSSVLGIFARQVHHSNHTFNEFYAPELEKWVWVDTHYALMARDLEGQYLSLVELRDRYLNEQEFEFVFIGTESHKLHETDPRESQIYDEPEDFANISITWGNNVLEEDELVRRLSFLPTSPRQLIGLLTGALPDFTVYRDEHTWKVPAMRRQKTLYSALVGFLAAGTLAYPLTLLIARRG